MQSSNVEKNDQALVELITIRLNTYFRFSLKHGQHHNEPRNLYNLVFHYGQFIDYLIENNERMGDPECQTILPKLKTNLIDIIIA